MREYFLERYLELHGERTLFPGSVSMEERMKDQLDPMAEQFVDVQVDQFISDLEHKLGAMKSTAKELETIHADAVSGQATEDAATRARVRELAQDVGDRAADLFNMVAVVMIDLRPKGSVTVPASSRTSEFVGSELRFLVKQVGKAAGRLKDLFLEPTNTVDLDELRGDNVLTELKSIEAASKEIKKKTLDSSGHSNAAE